jgi:hypothetical protein
MLGGGEVIADALVSGTPCIDCIVGIGVEVGGGVEAVFFTSRYPPAPKRTKNIVVSKINLLILFGVGIFFVGCCKLT